MPTTVGTSGRVLVLELKGHNQRIFSSRKKENRNTTLWIRKDEQEPAGTTATDSSIRKPHDRPYAAVNTEGRGLLGFGKNGLARQPQIPVSENHTTDLMQQSTPKGADFLGFGKNGAKTYQEVPLDHEYCRWIDQVEDQQPHWKLKRFSSWLKMQSVFQEPNV